jgi:hypothetical protein
MSNLSVSCLCTFFFNFHASVQVSITKMTPNLMFLAKTVCHKETYCQILMTSKHVSMFHSTGTHQWRYVGHTDYIRGPYGVHGLGWEPLVCKLTIFTLLWMERDTLIVFFSQLSLKYSQSSISHSSLLAWTWIEENVTWRKSNLIGILNMWNHWTGISL